MAEKIKLVQGDVNRPQIQATITDENTETAINITGATVVMKFRQVGATTLQATLPGVVTDGTNGVCVFEMSATALSGDPGTYEGEIQVTFPNGDIQTVYDLLKFQVREDF
jgi:hypothetical protein